MYEWLQSSWQWISGILILTVMMASTSHAILYKRDVKAAIGWVGLIWFAPALGSILYYLFGINRVERKARRLKRSAVLKRLKEAVPKPNHLEIIPPDHAYLIPLAELVHELSGTRLLMGNIIRPLVTGEEAYREMIEAINGATKSVGLSTYIFDNDVVGQRFVEALGLAVERGVDVRVLIDDLGSRYSWPWTIFGALKRVGVRTVHFMPQFLPWHFAYANLRNHRKILVVDGRIGFTGGMNIRAGHDASTHPKHLIVDMHFRLDGPVVEHLRRTFAEDWEFCKHERPSGEAWFPHLEPCGTFPARGFHGGPDDEFARVRAVCLGALATAKHSVRIVTPYFLPDTVLIASLDVAALRGIQIDIVIPSQNNLRLVQWACMGQIDQVLAQGCRVWLSPPPFDHTKLMIVDRAWVLFGSSNWDERSMRLNFEFDVEAYDSALAGYLEDRVEETIKRSRPLTLQQVNGRNLFTKLRDGTCRLMTPYL